MQQQSRSRIPLTLALLVAVTVAGCGKTADAPTAETAAATRPAISEPAGGAATAPAAVAPPEPAPEDVAVRSADHMTMVRVPAGEFLMGDDASAFAAEKPAHTVYLDEYWIDQTEVTNAQYRACAEAGVCSEPPVWNKQDLNGDDQPALVAWESARRYCEWAGALLPTEAEWEKAIRGTDGRIWPWGNEFEPRANLSGPEDGYGATSPVGSFPNDVSPYGLLDAAGNAAEWVSDWYDVGYYARSPSRNPTGPASGTLKVHRSPIANAGGGPEKCRCTARHGVNPDWEYGMRCVSPAQPSG